MSRTHAWAPGAALVATSGLAIAARAPRGPAVTSHAVTVPPGTHPLAPASRRHQARCHHGRGHLTNPAELIRRTDTRARSWAIFSRGTCACNSRGNRRASSGPAKRSTHLLPTFTSCRPMPARTLACGSWLTLCATMPLHSRFRCRPMAAASTGRESFDWQRWAVRYARVAIGAAFLSAVAGRFGLWNGSVDWANFDRFILRTAELNPFVPMPAIPLVAWAATILETTFWRRADRGRAGPLGRIRCCRPARLVRPGHGRDGRIEVTARLLGLLRVRRRAAVGPGGTKRATVGPG